MALEDMQSIFQPGETKNGKGLESVTNAGSELNVDDALSLSTGLAQGKGLETITNDSSDLNMDETPVPGTGLANGSGLIELGNGKSNLQSNGPPKNFSDGLAKQGEIK